MVYTEQYMSEFVEVCKKCLLNGNKIENIAALLALVKQRGGRLFIIGVGGGAANASHAVGDFRKIANIEAYTPSDNVAELTARTNDDGWDTPFIEWLKVSHLHEGDALLIFSVGGGNDVSKNITNAIEYAREIGGVTIIGIVGSNAGTTAKLANFTYILPEVDSKFRTPFTESMQAVIWHCIVNHPRLEERK